MPTEQISLWISGLSTLIAGLAFGRPEIEAFLRRWISQIDFFPHRRSEIGYSSFGPTIGIPGTIWAIRGKQYVREMHIDLTRRRDHKRHKFTWGLFRAHRLVVGSGAAGENMTAELAAGFTVNAGESMNFNNLFMDLDTRDRFFEKLSSLKEAWNNAKFNDEGIQQLLLQNQLAIAVSKFIKNESVIFQKAIESADHEFYWGPGEYELELVIDTNRPRKSFRFAGTFRLTQKESERLRANIHKMLMEFCDISGVPHDFAFPKVQWEHIHA